MKTIYKYPIEITDEQTVPLPMSADVLSVGVDPSGALCLWVLVDPDYPPADRKIKVRGTGNPADGVEADQLIGMVVQGPFVWHVFEGTA